MDDLSGPPLEALGFPAPPGPAEAPAAERADAEPAGPAGGFVRIATTKETP